MSVNVSESHLKIAQGLVDRAHRNDGLAPLDLDRFWEDQQQAVSNPWANDCPQAPLGIHMALDCVYVELGVKKEDWYRIHHDEEYRLALVRPYNDLAEKIVGRRVLNETKSNPALACPPIKALHDIFEAENAWVGDSYWLHQSAGTPDELKALLDRVETRLENLREFLLPADWAEGKAKLLAAGGKVPLYRGQRGPVTFAMSVFGVENLIYLLMDDPDLARRFSDLILKAMLERARVLDEEAGFTPETAPHGFYWCDDNCAMLNAEMYEAFGWPILKGIFDRYSPDPDDGRGQHSDSDMGHLLALLGKLDLTSTNFGPNVMVDEIREHLPRAVICGQLAPFTFSRNEEVNIVAEFLRDFEMAREKKGLHFATAGSINDGSRLSGMRLIMAAIQEYGRYA